MKKWKNKGFLKLVLSVFFTVLIISSWAFAITNLLTVSEWDKLTAEKWNALVVQVNENTDKLSIKLWERDLPWSSCKDILDNWWSIWDGVYWIQIWWNTQEVICDMTTDGWWYMLITTLTNATTNISGSVVPWNKWSGFASTTNFYSMKLDWFNHGVNWWSFMIKEWLGKWVSTDVSELYNWYNWKNTKNTGTSDWHMLMWKASWNIRWDIVNESYINKNESWDTIRWIKSCSVSGWCLNSWNEWLSIAYWSQNRWPCYEWWINISYWIWWDHSSSPQLCWWNYSDPRWHFPLTYWVR
jgi:hypothetical protein